MLPPLPHSLDGFHPLVVHFPVALLLVAPLLILFGLVWRGRVQGLMAAALVLMALGTAGTYLAVASGEAAGEMADKSGAVASVIERHEALAERTRLLFTLLTVAFAALLFVPRLRGRAVPPRVFAAATLVFLVLYGFGALSLANTAHQGGRLVHELGVRAVMPPSPSAAAAPAEKED